MKKAISYILLLLFTFTCSISLADNPEELIFLFFPWFSFPNEAIDILIKKGFLDENDNAVKRMIENPDKVHFTDTSSYLESNNDKKFPYVYNSNRYNALSNNVKRLRLRKEAILKTIAKQEINGITLQFWDDQGTLKLIECALSFVTDDTNAKSIYDALVKTYGKPKANKNKAQKALWYGGNSTIILKSYSNVIYATLDGINLSIESSPAEPEKEDSDF